MKAQLNSGTLGDDFHRRADQLQRDVQMLADLECIRLDQARVRDERFDWAGSDPEYGSAFRQYGIDVESSEPEKAAALVQGSAIREYLVAGLDDWAGALASIGQEESSLRAKRLLAVARQADPDPWRNQLRDRLLDRDDAGLQRLAESAPVEKLPAATLAMLGDLCVGPRARASEPAWQLLSQMLRRAQRRFPADFMINQRLGLALGYMQPPQLEQAVGFCRVAVALRPQSPGARVNLGHSLSKMGDLDGAIAELREAVRLKQDYALAHYSLGVALHHTGDLDGAIAEFREGLRLRNDSDAHNELGITLRDKGDLDGAIAEFREALRLRNDGFEAHHNLGVALKDKGDLAGAIAELREAVRLKKDSADAHYSLASSLRAQGDAVGAIAECREALRLRPDDPDTHGCLGNALYDKGDLDEAIAEFREAIRLKKDDARSHNNLGSCLRQKGDLDGAIAEHREAIRLNKDSADAHNNLGEVLRLKGDLGGALAELREAIRLKQDFALAHNNLGVALATGGDLSGAIAEFREAIRLKKDDARAHGNLGLALRLKGDLEGAVSACREAVRLDKDSGEAHVNLGGILRDKGDLDDALSELREAVRLMKNSAEAHNSLGAALRDKGDLDGAIAEHREAIRLNKDFAEAHCNLAHTLRQQGQFAEALASQRRGHELGSKDRRWPYPSAQWVKQCESLVELDAKLQGILKGEAKPVSVGQCLDLAWICCTPARQLYAAAVGLYTEAFTEEPQLVGEQPSGPRYNAARAAARAGCSHGNDSGRLPDKDYVRFRARALTWLREDLAAWRKELERLSDESRPVVVQQLQHWLSDKDFNGVRGPDALAKLPESEREGWQMLWADVAATLAKAQAKGAPEKKGTPSQQGPKHP